LKAKTSTTPRMSTSCVGSTRSLLTTHPRGPALTAT
jgi:hypothetical protein